jgi:hypothetical protein
VQRTVSEKLSGTVHVRSRQAGMLQSLRVAQDWFGKTPKEGLLVQCVGVTAEAEAINHAGDGIDVTYAFDFEAVLREEVPE